MALLTEGRTTGCENSVCSGGISDTLMLANQADIATTTVGMDGKVTAITMETDATFYSFDFKDFTANFTENLAITNGVSVVTQQFQMIWTCRNHPDRNLIMALAGNGCGMVAIHKENTGVTLEWGYLPKRHVYLLTADSQSGAALSDPNQTTLTLQCITSECAREFTPGIDGVPL
ncbi:MAG: hypothetical protein HC874_14220 [Richelia sp. SL_2_1]|nr:hypothetical protein [Richelia sp. SL_2_1]